MITTDTPPAAPAKGLPVRSEGARPSLLESLLSPRSVALIGASESRESVGRSLLENLTAHWRGQVYPVNPKYRQILGRPTYASIETVPAEVDLAVIATPAASVPQIVGECAAAGVKSAIVISAGFRETGEPGVELERQIMAKRGQMRLLGPNCLGAMVPSTGFNATFGAGLARPGSVAFLSQSGALCTAVLDWSLREDAGFSAFLSVGSMLDLGWADLLYYFQEDPRTHSIVMYMESIGDARSFLSAAREVALRKPIVVIKVGRTAEAARAAASHTGSLVGNDAVLDAAFQRAGVLRVDTIAELFAMAEVLGKQPRPAGPHLAIVTNAGGPGGLATDMLVANGGETAKLNSASLTALDALLPPHWSHANPVDVLGDASPERYARAVEIVSKDPNSDGTLVILTPQAMTDPLGTAKRLAALPQANGKPLFTSWMGGSIVEPGVEYLNRHGIPNFSYADTAARVFALTWRYSHQLRSIYETPSLGHGSEEIAANRVHARHLLAKVREAGRTLLTEIESMQVLIGYGIPVIDARQARTAAEAIEVAEKLGYPVALKLYSLTITHKSDVGGVKLDLRGADAVQQAFAEIERAIMEHSPGHEFAGVTVEPMLTRSGYELIVGSSMDEQFGPVLVFGMGGQLVDVFRDRAIGLPPLTATLARRMIEQTRIYQALRGVRGRPGINLDELEQLIVRFSHLVAEQRLIKEIDINPLHASPSGLVALDARIILHDPALPEENLPLPAIRPYPTDYIFRCLLRDGASVLLRPIRPEDEPGMIEFHRKLSEQSVHLRYFCLMTLDQRVAHERLARICFIDYDREIALVAERRSPSTHEREIIAVGRLSKLNAFPGEAEFAIVVADQAQGLGLGGTLLERLLEIGRKEKLTRICGHILPENEAMKHLCRKAGFSLAFDRRAEEVEAEISL